MACQSEPCAATPLRSRSSSSLLQKIFLGAVGLATIREAHRRAPSAPSGSKGFAWKGPVRINPAQRANGIYLEKFISTKASSTMTQ